MSQPLPPIISEHTTPAASRQKYTIGFGLSLAITLIAYLITTDHHISVSILEAILAGLAALQFIIQLVYFLHLGSESKPRWRLLVFSFMLGVVVIIVVGSLWIMHNLNYRMTPQQMQQYVQSQDGL